MNRWDGYNKSFLQHHGIKGQKWGVRRYQNNNGTYTEEGKERRRLSNKSNDRYRYENEEVQSIVSKDKELDKLFTKAVVGQYNPQNFENLVDYTVKHYKQFFPNQSKKYEREYAENFLQMYVYG